MKAKKATKPKWTTVATQWIYDDKSRARLIARERRKERARVARIVTQQITETLRVLQIDKARFPVSGATLSTIRHLDWQIKQAIKPAKKGAKR